MACTCFPYPGGFGHNGAKILSLAQNDKATGVYADTLNNGSHASN